MRVTIDESCVVCGKCEDICPEVFRLGEDIAEVLVDEVPSEFEEAVQEAADECPVEAIIVEE